MTERDDERARCAGLAIAVILSHRGRKGSNSYAEGWNNACCDIKHRIETEGLCLTTSPVPAMVQALQAVRKEALTPKTKRLVDEALRQFKNPKMVGD